MKWLFITLSMIGLLFTIGPSILVFAGVIEFSLHITLIFIGTMLWFLTAPFWIKKEQGG